jgi:hypothetical protein
MKRKFKGHQSMQQLKYTPWFPVEIKNKLGKQDTS